jgi:hypothetical protein
VEEGQLSSALRFRMEKLLNTSSKLERTTSGLTQMMNHGGDFGDIEMLNLDASAKKRIFDSNDSNIDKYLADNLYYHSEHHQGKNNILEREPPTRVTARLKTLEKLGDSVPMFMRDLGGYNIFSKEPTFANLGLLLKEVFDLAGNMAAKAYSPMMIDQLSLDQIVKDTSDFIIALFTTSINTDLKVREIHSLDDMLATFFHRNFETTQSDSQELLSTGLGVFLFFMLSKLYSENMNHHSVMEKLVATLLERIAILYLEFLIFLMVMNIEEATGTTKLFQTAFQGMYFDKMCDLVNRCTGTIDKFHEIVSATLKYSFIAFPTTAMLGIVNTFLTTVHKSKQDQFRQGVSFVLKIFNPKVSFELELSGMLKAMSLAYRSNLKYFISDCLKPGFLLPSVQSCFWKLHHIITQDDEEQSFESTIVAFRETINAVPNLKNKKQDILSFLWGFKEFFENKFSKFTDERVMVMSLNNIVCLRPELTDFVFLLVKPLDDKMIKKSLRIFLQTLPANDDTMILNLCDHLLFWKDRGFTKTGNDQEKFSLDVMILKRLEEYFDKRQGEIDRTILERLN